jgi:hypothetical protein
METALHATPCHLNPLGALSCSAFFSSVASFPPYILGLATGNQRHSS